jgi:hypothetical protein
MDLETITIGTRDSWGHPGVATYRRQSLWTTDGWAYVVADDTSTGHGWGGHMHRDRWDKLRDRAQA